MSGRLPQTKKTEDPLPSFTLLSASSGPRNICHVCSSKANNRCLSTTASLHSAAWLYAGSVDFPKRTDIISEKKWETQWETKGLEHHLKIGLSKKSLNSFPQLHSESSIVPQFDAVIVRNDQLIVSQISNLVVVVWPIYHRNSHSNQQLYQD